jgi:hypothetical protein
MQGEEKRKESGSSRRRCRGRERGKPGETVSFIQFILEQEQIFLGVRLVKLIFVTQDKWCKFEATKVAITMC